MEGHRTAERRSIAYHRAIAERLHAEPKLIADARARVATWGASGEVHDRYASAWQRLLELPIDEILKLLVADTEEMAALRQVSPFAGALDPRTRWQLWRSVG